MISVENLDTFSKIITILCLAIVLIFGLAICAIALARLYDRYNEKSRMDRIRQDELAVRRFGVDLVGAAHWFSSNPSTYEAMKILGEYVSNNGDLNVSCIRSQWLMKTTPSKE